MLLLSAQPCSVARFFPHDVSLARSSQQDPGSNCKEPHSLEKIQKHDLKIDPALPTVVQMKMFDVSFKRIIILQNSYHSTKELSFYFSLLPQCTSSSGILLSLPTCLASTAFSLFIIHLCLAQFAQNFVVSTRAYILRIHLDHILFRLWLLCFLYIELNINRFQKK